MAHRDSSCANDAFFAWPFTQATSLSQHVRHVIALRSAVHRWKPNLVHSFSRLAYLLALLGSDVPAVMSYQRHTGGKRIGRMASLLGKKLRFTACSEFIAAMGRPWGGDWDVIPNFVDCDFFEFRNEVPADAPLVFLSRVEEIKGPHLAIEIARRAQRKLLIAGNIPETPDGIRYWKIKVEPLVDGSLVCYVGAVDDFQKRDLLQKAAAMIVPVQWGEPFGIVFAEALACGTPVISCPDGALPEIVRDGEHGFLIRTIDEGVNAVKRLQTISRSSCRAHAESSFSASAVVIQYEALYQGLSR
jgi:glycosyltransferase involved in cell wall biosynthesis